MNLVPACPCNSKRGELLLGDSPGERILHPYFDTCLAERLLKARFVDPGEVPRVDVVTAVETTHPNYAAVNFHLERLVKKTAIIGYMQTRWAKLLRSPTTVVREFASPLASVASLEEIIKRELRLLDDEHGGKNNWPSVFAAGLLDPPIIAWLFVQLTKPGRDPDDALLGS